MDEKPAAPKETGNFNGKEETCRLFLPDGKGEQRVTGMEKRLSVQERTDLSFKKTTGGRRWCVMKVWSRTKREARRVDLDVLVKYMGIFSEEACVEEGKRRRKKGQKVWEKGKGWCF